MSKGVNDGRDETNEAEITWVGEQRLMAGYCGRAPAPPGGAKLAAAEKPAIPVREMRARQARVVRIGPAVGAKSRPMQVPLRAAQRRAAA